MTHLTITLEPPLTPELIGLIEALDAYQRPLYPAASTRLPISRNKIVSRTKLPGGLDQLIISL